MQVEELHHKMEIPVVLVVAEVIRVVQMEMAVQVIHLQLQ